MTEAPQIKSGPTSASGKHVGKVKNKLPAAIQITGKVFETLKLSSNLNLVFYYPNYILWGRCFRTF